MAQYDHVTGKWMAVFEYAIDPEFDAHDKDSLDSGYTFSIQADAEAAESFADKSFYAGKVNGMQ